MEIAEITIRNFKGIEEVRMGPIRPINVLIGRNNSGKSSVLTSLKLLSQYFGRERGPGMQPHNPTISLKDECFKKDTGEDGYLEITVTVDQTREEREKQFNNVITNWNTRYEQPKMGSERVGTQLGRNALGRLMFDFRATFKGKKFGLVSIWTVEGEKSTRANIGLTVNKNPGGTLQGISLLHLFVHKGYGRPQFDSISELAKEEKLKQGMEIILAGGRLSAGKPICGVALLNPAFECIKSTFGSSFLVSPYRHGQVIMAAQRCKELNESGQNLVNYLHNLHLNDYHGFHKVAEFVKEIAPEVGRLHPRLVSEQGSELELAYEWPDGRVVNLANMGGGVEQLLILGCILLHQKTACVLWEEPESHLHPGAQDNLISMLEKNIGESVLFMTSHSPVFVRSSEKVAVHIITNPDGKSGTGRTLLADELQEAAAMLGSRPGHLAQADIVVYVEGKWGAAAFEEWLKKWPEKNNVLGHLLLVVQPCNPDEIGTVDYDLGKLKKVTANMVMFVDKDNDPGSGEPKKTRKVLLGLCHQNGIPCIITHKRQIEDYFTEEAVRKGLPSNIANGWNYDSAKAMSEQLPTKKHNARIAAAMEWKDVEKNEDIMKVFKEIENYAKKLKPEVK